MAGSIKLHCGTAPCIAAYTLPSNETTRVRWYMKNTAPIVNQSYSIQLINEANTVSAMLGVDTTERYYCLGTSAVSSSTGLVDSAWHLFEYEVATRKFYRDGVHIATSGTNQNPANVRTIYLRLTGDTDTWYDDVLASGVTLSFDDASWHTGWTDTLGAGSTVTQDTASAVGITAVQHGARTTDITVYPAPIEAQAETLTNWTIDGGVTLVSAELVSTNVVRLKHSNLTEGASYTITASAAVAGTEFTDSFTSDVPNPSDMRLLSAVSRDSQHTDLTFSYEPQTTLLVSGNITIGSATFTSATKQADPRVVRVKHSNLDNGTYTASVDGDLLSVFGEACNASYDEASFTVALQHDSTTGLKSQGVYNGVLLGPQPAGDIRLAYVGANSLTVDVYRSADAATFSQVDTVWPSGKSGWAAGTVYKPWDVIEESGRTYHAVRVLGKHVDYQGKAHASTEPTWPSTAGATVDDKTSNATYGESYAGGTYYGVVWQENTSVTVAAAVAEGSNYAYLIHDRRPAYRDQAVEIGEEATYKVSVDGGSNFSNTVAVTSQVNKAAQESLHLYKWRTEYLYGGAYAYKPFSSTAGTAANPSESAYAGCHVLSLAEAYRRESDAEYLWLIERQMDYLISCQYGTTGSDRWLDASNAWSPGTYSHTWVDHQMRSVLYVYLAALLLERASETAVSASLKQRVDIWAQAFLDWFTPQSLTCTWTALGYGTQRSTTASSQYDRYVRDTKAQPTTGIWTPNMHMSDAALFALLYSDADSALYQSASALGQVADVVTLSHATIGDTGEQVKALQASASPTDYLYDDGTGYYDSHLYAVYNNLLALIIRDSLSSEDWPTYLDVDTTAVYKWTAGSHPEWQASHTYSTGDIVTAPVGNRFIDGSQHFIYVCTAGGQSGSSAPTWPTTQNATVADNAVTWKARAHAGSEPVLDINYPGTFDGSFDWGWRSIPAMMAAQQKLAGDYSSSPLYRLTTSSAYVNPDDLKIGLTHQGQWGYSPSGYPTAFGSNVGYYENSNEGSFTSECDLIYQAVFALPAAPSSVEAEFEGSSVELSWTRNATNNTGVYVERKVDTGAWEAEATLAADAVTHTDSDLPETWETLQYRVANYNADGTGAWAESNVLEFRGEDAAFGVTVTFTATGYKSSSGSADFTVTPSVTGTGAKGASGAASFDATSAQAGAGAATRQGAADYTAHAALTAQGRKGASGAATFDADATLTADGANADMAGLASFGATVTFSAQGYKGGQGAADFDATADLTSAGESPGGNNESGSADLTAHVTFTATGYKSSQSAATFDGHLAFTAIVARRKGLTATGGTKRTMTATSASVRRLTRR